MLVLTVVDGDERAWVNVFFGLGLSKGGGMAATPPLCPMFPVCNPEAGEGVQGSGVDGVTVTGGPLFTSHELGGAVCVCGVISLFPPPIAGVFPASDSEVKFNFPTPVIPKLSVTGVLQGQA